MNNHKSFKFQSYVIDFEREVEGEDLIVGFKFQKSRTNITKMIQNNEFIFAPTLTALEIIILLTKTTDGSIGFWDQGEKKQGSKTFLSRLIDTGGVRFNGKILKSKEVVDFPIFSIVVFPKSDKFHTTLL